MASEATCIACKAKRVVKGVTPVAKGYVMQSLECPKCSDLYRIVVRRGRSHAGYRAAFVDSTDHQDNIKLEGAGGCTPRAGLGEIRGLTFLMCQLIRLDAKTK
jgi:transcription elongation factor Elf1